MSYCCPNCGEPTTQVRQTYAFPQCIFRKRYCLTCGEEHETTEVYTDFSDVWTKVVDIILQYGKAKQVANKAV